MKKYYRDIANLHWDTDVCKWLPNSKREGPAPSIEISDEDFFRDPMMEWETWQQFLAALWTTHRHKQGWENLYETFEEEERKYFFHLDELYEKAKN